MPATIIKDMSIESFVEVLFYTTPEAVIVFNADSTICQANEDAAAIFYYDLETFMTLSLDDLIPPQLHDIHEHHLDRYQAHPVKRQMGMVHEIKGYRRDGTTIPLEVGLNPVNVQDMMYTICIVRDLTAQKLLEEQLQQTQLNQLKAQHHLEKIQLQENFLAMASHDLRNPLAIIKTSVDVLSRYYHRMNPDHRQVHWDRIQTQIKYMALLLDDVLSLTYKNDRDKTIREPGDLVTYCEVLCQNIKLLQDKRFTFEYDSGLRQVKFAPDVLRKILDNLLTNAMKYTEASGTIHLKISRDVGTIVLEVSDTGIGIPEHDLEELFMPFQRASNVGDINGTGLGLAIVKKNVEIYGGTIAVRSKPGVGTIFTVSLPE